MNPELYVPRKKRKKRIWLRTIGLLVGILFVFAGLYTYSVIEQYLPNQDRVTLDFNGLKRPIFYQHELYHLDAVGEGEDLKLPFDLIKEMIDPSIIYDESSQSVIITTENKVLQLTSDQLTEWVNEHSIPLYFPLEMIEDHLYLSIRPLLDYYKLDIRESEESGAVFIYPAGEIIQWGVAVQDAKHPEKKVPMRVDATIKAPIAHELKPEDRVMILQEEPNGWYFVQLTDGFKGYIKKSHIRLDQIEQISVPAKEPSFVPWKPMGEKINLTWEQVEVKTPSTENIGPMPGLNVVSPTWFRLEENQHGEINVRNLADPAYVKWAHDRGYQVWALFSNSFKPDLTSKALADFHTRMKIIKQLVSYAEMYDLDGINIDFENVYLKDKDAFTQFVREMTPVLHEQGLVVSIDVTVRGGSEMYSLFADRRELGKVVDYMIVMTYDEHWATSPVAGSVASLPWVEKGIVDIMREDDVPASKLVLGVPYYTRVWTEEYVDGQLKVSSRAIWMSSTENILREKNLQPVYLEDVGQHYVEYEEDGKTIKIWIEDEVSMRSRIELVNKYDLAGVASWRRGYESPEIWEVIQETLAQRP